MLFSRLTDQQHCRHMCTQKQVFTLATTTTTNKNFPYNSNTDLKQVPVLTISKRGTATNVISDMPLNPIRDKRHNVTKSCIFRTVGMISQRMCVIINRRIQSNFYLFFHMVERVITGASALFEPLFPSTVTHCMEPLKKSKVKKSVLRIRIRLC